MLGTTYGSQARHERMWTALADGGPRAVDPNDFALSTFNAPGSAVASAYGFGGANLVFLGATGRRDGDRRSEAPHHLWSRPAAS